MDCCYIAVLVAPQVVKYMFVVDIQPLCKI